MRSCRVYDNLPITHAILCTLQSVAAGHAAEQRRPHGGLFPQVPSHQVSGNSVSCTSGSLHVEQCQQFLTQPSACPPGTLVVARGLSTRSNRCVANHSLQESAQLPHLGGCWKAWSACQQCSLLPCDCQLVSQTALLGISSKPRACTVCCLQACGLGWSLVRPLFAVCKAVV